MLPFGLSTSVASFGRAIEMLMGHGLDDCTLWYVDDMLIASGTFEDHIKDLKRVFVRLKKFGLTLNLDKTRLFKNSAPFLGHLLVPGVLVHNRRKLIAFKIGKHQPIRKS